MQRFLFLVTSLMPMALLGHQAYAQEVELPGFTVSSENGLSVSEAVERDNKPIESTSGSAEEIEKEPAKFVPSYGSFEGSIFFTGRQIEQMKKVLFLTERFTEDETQTLETNEEPAPADGLDEFPIALPQPTEDKPKEIVTPDSFPTFVVSSIIHRGTKDWVLWLNGKRVTPDTVPEELKISQVSGRSVKVLWSPKEAASFLLHHESIKEKKPTKSLKKVLSRNSKVEQVGTDQWEFTLKPNQTFDSRHMAVLEGKNPQVKGVQSDKIVKKLEGPSAEDILRQAGFDGAEFQGESEATTSRKPRTLEDRIRGTLGALQQSDRMLQGFQGRRGGGQRSGFRTDADLPSDRKASTPPAVEEAPEPTTKERLQQALPAFLESIGVTPQKEENNTSNEGLPILPN